MSIKSTRRLTRAEAEALYHELYAKLYGAPPLRMTNEELGDALDEMHEAICRREGTTCFDNYLVEGLSGLYVTDGHAALSYAVDRFERFLSSGGFSEANEMLAKLEVEKVHPLALLGILAITFPGKELLPRRADFLSRAERVVIDHYGRERAEELLRNRR